MQLTHSFNTRVLRFWCFALLAGCPAAEVFAVNGTWAVNADGIWSDPSNWSGGIVAAGIDSTANFTTAIGAPRTVTLDTDRLIGSLVFDGPIVENTWNLSGSKTLTLGVSSGLPAITSAISAAINTSVVAEDGFTKLGTQTLALTAANTIGGTTTVNSGTLQANDNKALPVTTNLNLNGGSYETSGVLTRSLGTGAGQIQWTGSGGFSAGAGSMGVDLGGGTGVVAWGSGSFVPGGQDLLLEGSVDFQNDIDLAGGDRAVKVSGGKIGYGWPLISGSISNGNLIKVGYGQSLVSAPLILTGNNTYGSTTFGIGDTTAGTLQIGNGGTTGTLGTGTVSFDGHLDFDRSDSMTVTNTITSQIASWIDQIGSGTTTLSGNLGGYQGDVQISKGTLVFDYGTFDSSKVSDRGLLDFYGGSLQLAGGTHQEKVGQTDFYGPATIGRTSGSATINLNAMSFVYGGSVDVAGDNIAISANPNINGALPGVTVGGRLAKNASGSGYGNIVALADTDYVNVPRLGGQITGGLANVRIIDGGTAGPITMPLGTTAINSISQIAANGSVNIDIGVGNTLRMASYGTILVPPGASPVTITGGTLTAGGTPNSDSTLAVQNFADVTIVSNISNDSASSSPWSLVELAKQGPGRLILAGNNTYTRGTYITGGTLQIGTGGTNGAVTGSIVNNGSLSFNRSDNVAFTNLISGSGTLSQDGVGTLTLSKVNTYTGATTINTGTLVVNNTSGSGTGTGPVTVNSGAILGGAGAIAGAVANNGTIAPGATVGTLHLGSDFTQSVGGTLQIELASASSSDRLVVNGSATLDGTLEVQLVGGYLPQDGTQFDFLDWGTHTGTFANVELPALPAGLGWDSSQLYTTGTLTVTGLAGDFNVDGVVNAADYVTWRINGGTQAEYNLWRANFGRTQGSSAVGSATVPEPRSSILTLLVSAIVCAQIRNRSRGV